MAIKTLLTASVLSVIGAAVSTAAFADNMVNASTFCKPGFYAGVQGGRSDTFYNASNTLQTARADGVGDAYSTYYGRPSGYLTTTNTLTTQKVDDIGIGGRIYAGYQFNPYFALETGYTQYAKTDFSATGNQSTLRYGAQSPGAIAVDPVYVYDGRKDTINHYNGEVTEHAIDLVGKATLPLQMGFGLYAKAGMAYIAADSHTNRTTSTETYYSANNSFNGVVNVNTTSTIDTHSYQGFRPVAGVGVNYSIPNTNMSLNADYTRVFSYGGIPNAKLASLGIEYKFA